VFSEIADVLLVLFNLLGSSGEVQSDLGHVVNAGVANIPYGDTSVRIALFDLHEAFSGTKVRRRSYTDVLGSDLLQKQELFVGWLSGRLRAELNARRDFIH